MLSSMAWQSKGPLLFNALAPALAAVIGKSMIIGGSGSPAGVSGFLQFLIVKHDAKAHCLCSTSALMRWEFLRAKSWNLAVKKSSRSV